MLVEFERQNSVTIEMVLEADVVDGVPDVGVRASAWAQNVDKRGAKPLALQRLGYRQGRFKSLEGLVTYLLYQLDFQLASFELDEKKDS